MEKKKILVIDDELDFLESIKKALEANNYLAVVTSNAKEVSPKAEEQMPDLIILDIVMPDMNGYQICELLRQGKKTKKIPIVLLTGQNLEPRGITERCLKLGIDSYLFKPISIKDLLAKGI